MAHDRERLRGEQAASGPAHPTLLQRLADNCYRHRQSVLGAWVLLLVALVSISSVGESSTTTSTFPCSPSPPSWAW